MRLDKPGPSGPSVPTQSPLTLAGSFTKANQVTDATTLSQAIRNGDRRALARAITLVESTRDDHRKDALAVLDACAGSGRQALRLGLSGTPGVGKSTFIEALGLMLIARGLRVAVLAVDPSSARSGGSILGDKTRMEQLSRTREAFIRPSPSQRTLGGVGRRTREAAALCEAAGYDVILIETVGVGQSETMVAEMTDVFALLLAPAGGDELQGVKRGIMEIADLVIVNKADGDLAATASRTAADYAGALRLMRKREGDPEGFPKAITVSALEGNGVEAAWDEIKALANWRRDTGVLADRRQRQAVHWLRDELRHGLQAALESRAGDAIKAAETDVAAGKRSPAEAAGDILASFLRN